MEESEKAITTQFKADHFKEQAEVIKKQCSPRSEKYQEYMRLRDQAVLFSRESREHLNASKYFLKAFVLLCDMWGGKTT